MDINFCCARLKTEISSSTVSCEGHDVSNLLSSDIALHSKGFLAEGFAKPPVSLILKFFCTIDINQILVWTEVGSQKSNGLELLVSSESQEGPTRGHDESNSRQENSKIYFRIGSCKLKNETGILFQKYSRRPTAKVPVNFIVKYFNTSAANALKKSSTLELKIFSTANSSVPAIKKIEVWGRPSRDCPENVRSDIYKLWHYRDCETILPSKNDITSENDTKYSSSSCSVSTTDIPEEFLDPITLSIMAIPMTLPCGKTVDVSTLEKFESVESCWGRRPSDPYTGVPYTNTVFPIPDPALKSRIDQFLMENCHLEELKGVGRTVGRGKKVRVEPLDVRCGSSSLMHQEIPSNSSIPLSDTQQCSLSVIERNHEESESVENSNEVKQGKKDRTLSRDGLLSGVPVGDAKATAHSGIKRKRFQDSSSSSVVSSKMSRGPSTSNHEDDIEDSLDLALQCVLSGLPSFVKAVGESSNAPESTNANISGCCQCLTKECLFSLPCQHLICRSCLVSKSSGNEGEMACEVCQTHYTSKDVMRYHAS